MAQIQPPLKIPWTVQRQSLLQRNHRSPKKNAVPLLRKPRIRNPSKPNPLQDQQQRMNHPEEKSETILAQHPAHSQSHFHKNPSQTWKKSKIPRTNPYPLQADYRVDTRHPTTLNHQAINPYPFPRFHAVPVPQPPHNLNLNPNLEPKQPHLGQRMTAYQT